MATYHSSENVTKTHTYTNATQSQSQKGELPSSLSPTLCFMRLAQSISYRLGVSADSTNIWGEELSHCLELSCRILLHLWTTFIRETQTRSHPFLKSLGWGRHRVPWKEGKPPWAHVWFVYSFSDSILQRELFEHIDNCMSALLPRKPEPPEDQSIPRVSFASCYGSWFFFRIWKLLSLLHWWKTPLPLEQVEGTPVCRKEPLCAVLKFIFLGLLDLNL